MNNKIGAIILAFLAPSALGFNYTINVEPELFELKSQSQPVTEQGILQITNTNDFETVLNLRPADGTFTQDNQPASTVSSTPRQAGSWIDLQNNIISLQPEESKTIDFQLVIPPNTPPGTYVGAINAYFSRGNTAVTTTTGQGAGINFFQYDTFIVDLDGERILSYQDPVFNFTNTSEQPLSFSYKFNNSGNVNLKLTSFVSVSNSAGQEILNYQFPDQIAQANSPISDSTIWYDSPNSGEYQINYTYQVYETDFFDQTETLIEENTLNYQFSRFPWRTVTNAILYTLLALAIIFGFLIFKHLTKPTLFPYTVQPNENINSIAEKYHINWKKIATYNNIKPPYILTEGQAIKLPLPKHNHQLHQSQINLNEANPSN